MSKAFWYTLSCKLIHLILTAGKGVIIHFSIFICETEFQRVQLSKSYTKVKSIPSMLDGKDHSLVLLWTFHSSGIGVELIHQLHIWFICLLRFHCLKRIFNWYSYQNLYCGKEKVFYAWTKLKSGKFKNKRKKKNRGTGVGEDVYIHIH